MSSEDEGIDLVDLVTKPYYTRYLAPCLIAGEAVLSFLIVRMVPYTEIDWETYMTQVHTFLPSPGSSEPEFDYSKISGPTGPLVYPAIHLYLHTALYFITGKGENIQLAQLIYGGVYLVTLALVIACYRRVGAPPWLLLPLVLSKRLHSIFLLRLFNDCWVTLFFWLCVFLLQRRYWFSAAMAWTIGLGIKMTMLLTFPGLAILLIQGAGMEWAVFILFAAWFVQFGIAMPFLVFKVHGSIYLTRAFDLGRVFLYKWTVNWRFVSEKTFLSKEFAIGLMVLHVLLLLVFLHLKWIKPSGASSLKQFIFKYLDYMSMDEEEEKAISKRVTPTMVMDTMLASMSLGLLCARSLHYQFFAYLGWTAPYLLWRAGVTPVFALSNWFIQEWAWNQYPSTEMSSRLVVVQLALQAICGLTSLPTDHIRPPARSAAPPAKKEEKKQQ